MSKQTTSALSDDLIYRGAVISLQNLRDTDEAHSLYGAYRAAALAWVNEAQERLSGSSNPRV